MPLYQWRSHRGSRWGRVHPHPDNEKFAKHREKEWKRGKKGKKSGKKKKKLEEEAKI